MTTRTSPAALLLALLALSLGGCAALVTPLPAPAAGLQRELVEPRGSTCRGDRCTYDLDVGARRVRVVERTREPSRAELRGGDGGSVVGRAASAIAGAIMRRNGMTTTHTRATLATWRIDDAQGTLRLHCDVAWIDEETRERVSGEERRTTQRIADGWACTAVDRADTTVVRWTARAGLTPAVDALGAAVARVDAGESLDAPPGPTLVRAPTARSAREYYAIERVDGDAGRGVLAVRTARWSVRRADGTVVGVVHHPALPRTALDLAAHATADEAALVRLLAAAIAQPLR